MRPQGSRHRGYASALLVLIGSAHPPASGAEHERRLFGVRLHAVIRGGADISTRGEAVMRRVSQALASNAFCRPMSRGLAVVALTAIALLGLAPRPATASAPGTWTLTGSMSTPRDGPTAVLLPSGKVLIFGGTTCFASPCPASTSSTELYDPAAGTWSPTGSFVQPPATNLLGGALLKTGKVLAVGFFGSGGTMAAELYDPATGAWTTTGSPTQAVGGGFSTTLLLNGKVLIAGGAQSQPSANLYDPQAGTWSVTGAPVVQVGQHTAVLLANGQVLIAGGLSGGAVTATAQLYNPVTGAWSLTGSMNTARIFNGMALLPSGKVLVAGGDTTGFATLNSAELYDPAAGTWSPTGSMANSRDLFTLTVLSDRTALAAGGNAFQAELFDPITGTWSPTGGMIFSPIAASATLLLSGEVLVAGGLGLALAELYMPQGAIDVTPPIIAITSPTNTIYALNQSVLANYSCTDPDSPVATCVGTVANGSPVDTASVGTKTFTVNATDPSGNASTQSVVYTVSYNICALYDQTKVVQSGSTVPIKVELCDASGADAFSSSVVVTATALTQMSTGAAGAVQASGNSNPDNNFRFDPTLGTSGGYIYNFSTKGLMTGTYALSFTAANDPVIHMVQFEVR